MSVLGALGALGDALAASGSMAWQIAWSLVLGFALSAVVQAVVRRDAVVDALGDQRPATLARATGLGIASSSCSYAAVALARSLFRKGASFSAAIVFQIASTNLVIELGIIMALLLGWQFTLAEFIGGVLIILFVAGVFRLLLRPGWVEEARTRANGDARGSMEGHAAMDMSVEGEGPWWQRLASADGVTAVSHVFVMEWAAVLRDILAGLLIAGAVSAWVPDSFWEHLFGGQHDVLSAIIGPLIGPAIAILSFVCSIGNVPLAAVLYRGGIGIGGAVSFLFADLLILPILAIYRKYYGTRMMLILLGVLYVAVALTGYAVGALFHLAHLVPDPAGIEAGERAVSWNYTTYLNIVALAVAAVLTTRFLRTGGRKMLAEMS